MSFIIKSKNNDSETLRIDNLSLAYKINSYKNDSIRNLFVNFFSSPLKTMNSKVEVHNVLEDISFSIDKGERVGLVGNNGSGKSSLCRLIAGLYGDSHMIKLNGEVRGIFDTEVAVLPELTGRENLELLVHLFYPKLSKSEKKLILQETIEFCDLGNFLDSPFKIYSKGMRARLFLSLISARPCDLLILDEVYNGADQFFSNKISSRLKKTMLDSKSVIFVSHSEDLVKEICNRVLVFHMKKIVFDGSPEDAYKYYHKYCNTTKIEFR